MAYDTFPLDKRIKENIRNYGPENLFDLGELREQMKLLRQLTGMQILLTDRHGEKLVSVGNFLDFAPDVEKEPGRKLRVSNRTIGHIYTREDASAMEKREDAALLVEQLASLWEQLGEQVFLNRERTAYIDELELQLEKEKYRMKNGEKEDVLTGALNRTYFMERMKVLERSEVVPIAVLEVNVNDWKFANDHYGDEESDRLIRIIAQIIKEEAAAEYIIGRVDGDAFRIMIPMPKEQEAELYGDKIQKRCREYTDIRLSPSVAVGIMYKSNVEEKLEEIFAEAQYKMFENKFEIKQNPVYQARLHRNIK